jgi:hypothetical protein
MAHISQNDVCSACGQIAGNCIGAVVVGCNDDPFSGQNAKAVQIASRR